MKNYANQRIECGALFVAMHFSDYWSTFSEPKGVRIILTGTFVSFCNLSRFRPTMHNILPMKNPWTKSCPLALCYDPREMTAAASSVEEAVAIREVRERRRAWRRRIVIATATRTCFPHCRRHSRTKRCVRTYFENMHHWVDIAKAEFLYPFYFTLYLRKTRNHPFDCKKRTT